MSSGVRGRQPPEYTQKRGSGGGSPWNRIHILQNPHLHCFNPFFQSVLAEMCESAQLLATRKLAARG